MVARNSLIVLLIIFLVGCSPAASSPTPAPVTETTQTLTPPTAEASTTAPDYVQLVRNAQYQLGASNTPSLVQLTDGKYEQGTPGGVDFISVTLTDFVASGDLNGDGVDEVAALIGENYGGTGTFVFLAVFANVNDMLTFQTSAIVDDRPALNALSIENGEVFLDAITHASEDPFCCPTLKTNRHYRLIADGQLEMTDYSTFTPDGRPRIITIDVPANGTETYSSVQVRGSFSIGPFENNLTYRLYSTGDVELAAGAITVLSDGLGGPGTFDTIITVGNTLSGALVRLEIQDISAADGSLLAMDSVELVVK